MTDSGNPPGGLAFEDLGCGGVESSAPTGHGNLAPKSKGWRTQARVLTSGTCHPERRPDEGAAEEGKPINSGYLLSRLADFHTFRGRDFCRG
jgi:hypothetical protein